MLTCTICGQPSFAKLRIEVDFLPGAAATYLICTRSACMAEAGQRAVDNLFNAASTLDRKPEIDHIDVGSIERST